MKAFIFFNEHLKVTLILLISLFSFLQVANACSIFCAARNGEILAAGNEDWSDPFSKLWVSPKTTERYGSVNLGHSDYQIQAAINEHGLFYDFAVIPKAEGRNMEAKTQFEGDLFYEILGKCKTVDEALVYLKKHQYASSNNQVLLGDATGKSIIVNQDIILEKTEDYQITTNFNTCDLATGNYDCRRYAIIDEGLSSTKEISVPLFRTLLSRSHQEGSHPTQYSYVFDLKRGIIYLYAFHNYENVVILNVKEELAGGFKTVDLKGLFPISYEEEYFRIHHKDALKQNLLITIKKEGAEKGIASYEAHVKNNPKTADYPFLLWDLGASLLIETSVLELKGRPFYFWWHPKSYFDWKSDSPNLDKALTIFSYLESIPKEDPKQNIGAFEMKGFIYYLKNNREKASEYYRKTMAISPKETGNYMRADLFNKQLNP